MCPFSRVKLDLNFLALEMTIQLLPGEAVPGSKSVRQNGGNSRLLGLLVPVPQTASLPLYSRSNRISSTQAHRKAATCVKNGTGLQDGPLKSHLPTLQKKKIRFQQAKRLLPNPVAG